MNKQLFLLVSLTVLPTVASQKTFRKKHPPRTPSICVTIDDHLTDPQKCTIEVVEYFSDPYNRDEVYKLELALDKRSEKWLPQFYKTSYTQDPKPSSKVIGTTKAISELPQAKKEELNKLLSKAAFGHIYLHRCDHIGEIWTRFYKDPLKWLRNLTTLRKTTWAGNNQRLILMDHTNMYRELLARSLQGARALYAQTKDEKDQKELKKIEFRSDCQSSIDATRQTRFGYNLILWKKGVFQEIARQEKEIADQRAFEKYKKELKEWKKAHNQWVQQRLEIRPQHMKDFLLKRTKKREQIALKRENVLLKRRLKSIKLAAL
jgi:hypothetical protein